ncbi:MAG TPA: heme biosynthesis HemY N-terminal domain-containing protein [Stellaceae bacterium]|nr:heme biosynthesis HemY N-terminal domain-containing protein [Stellaceae bacterium]
MRRLLLTILLAALLVAIAVFFADRPGSVSLTWDGWQMDTSVDRLVLAVAVLFAVLALLLWLLRTIFGAPGRWRKAWHERRRREGYRALTQGMVAVAAGEPEEAERLARRADVLLAEPPLTLLLQAQAAQLNGDETAARNYFLAMLERPETEFLGLRGLLTQALKTGNEAEALTLAERARRLRPKTGWALTSLTELQARAQQWKEAEATLLQAVKRRALPAPEARRLQSALLLEQSRAASAAGDGRGALALAERAGEADPGFAPAAAWRATLLRDGGRLRQAARAIEAAWRLAPEPALAEVYRSLAPAETPMQRLKRLQELAAANPDHLESRLLLAEATLRARLWGEARRYLGMLGASDDGAGAAPPARACLLMAELEEGERQDAARARAWLARAAAGAGQDATYVCAKCSTEAQHWAAVCPNCRGFASLVWRLPPRAPRDLAALPVPPPALPAPSAASPTPRLTRAKLGS